MTEAEGRDGLARRMRRGSSSAPTWAPAIFRRGDVVRFSAVLEPGGLRGPMEGPWVGLVSHAGAELIVRCEDPDFVERMAELAETEGALLPSGEVTLDPASEGAEVALLEPAPASHETVMRRAAEAARLPIGER